MKKIFFITPKEVKANSPIQLNIDEKLIWNSIQVSQEISLRIVLSDNLYFQLINSVIDETLTDSQKDLINVYIIPYLIQETLRHFIVQNEFKITNKGTQKLSDPNSLNVSLEEFNYAKDQIDNNVDSYKRLLIKHLETLGLNKGSTSYINTGGGFYFPGAKNKCGKGNSSSNIPTQNYIPLKEKGQPNGVATLDENGTVPIGQLPDFVSKEYVDEELDKKVDKEAGKGLSSNDYTNEDKAKVDIIQTNGDGSKILANNGQYVDNTGVQSDWNENDPSEPDYIQNKPDLDLKLNKIWNDIVSETNTLLTDELVINRGTDIFKTTISSILNHLDTEIFIIVTSLPAIGEPNKIYLLPSNDPDSDNIFEEWIYIEDEWELLGSVRLDLSNYYDKDEVNALLTAKQDNITGAASTITSSNLTANRALVSDNNGKVNVSDVTSTQLGYLNGVTSSIQTQLNSKITLASLLTGLNILTPGQISASDSILSAFGKLQYQIDNADSGVIVGTYSERIVLTGTNGMLFFQTNDAIGIYVYQNSAWYYLGEPLTTKSFSSNYTLVSADIGYEMLCNAITNVTITIPSGVFKKGHIINLTQMEVGTFNLVAASGINLLYPSTFSTTSYEQYATVRLKFITDVDVRLDGLTI